MRFRTCQCSKLFQLKDAQLEFDVYCYPRLKPAMQGVPECLATPRLPRYKEEGMGIRDTVPLFAAKIWSTE